MPYWGPQLHLVAVDLLLLGDEKVPPPIEQWQERSTIGQITLTRRPLQTVSCNLSHSVITYSSSQKCVLCLGHVLFFQLWLLQLGVRSSWSKNVIKVKKNSVIKPALLCFDTCKHENITFQVGTKSFGLKLLQAMGCHFIFLYFLTIQFLCSLS